MASSAGTSSAAAVQPTVTPQARHYFYTEALSRTTTTTEDFSYQKASLTFQPVANKRYAIFWNVLVDGNAAASSDETMRAFLFDDTGDQVVEWNDFVCASTTHMYTPLGGMYIWNAGSSPPSNTWSIYCARGPSATLTLGMSEAVIFAIELIDGYDVTSSLATPTTYTSTTYTPHLQLNFAQSALTDVFVICYAETQSTVGEISIRFHDGTTVYNEHSKVGYFWTTDWNPYTAAIRLQDIASKTFTIGVKSSDGSDINIRQAHICVLDLGGFLNSYIAEDRTPHNSVSGTYADSASITDTPEAVDHVVLAVGQTTTDVGSVDTATGQKINAGGSDVGTIFTENIGWLGYTFNWFSIRKRTESNTSTTWKTRYARTLGSNTATSDEHVLAVLQLAGLGSATGSAAGVSTATATGRSTAAAVASAAGTSTATAGGQRTAAAAASSTGISTAVATGQSTFTAVAAAAGTSTASAFAFIEGSTASASGTSAAAAVGESTAASAAASAGVATAAATGQSTAVSVASSAGVSTAQAIGGSTAAAAGSSTGTSTAGAVGATLAAAPTPASSGTGSNVGIANPTPTWPAVVTAGQYGLLIGYVKNDAAGTLTAPSGWTAISGSPATGGADKLYCWSFDGLAVGTEDGATVTLTQSGTTGRRAGLIVTFDGVDATTSIEGYIEQYNSTTTVVADAAVTTSGTARLAVNVIGYTTRQTAGQEDLAGESGGTWAPTFYYEGGANPTLSVQTATIASSATIDGGSGTPSPSSQSIVIGFALFNAASAAAGAGASAGTSTAAAVGQSTAGAVASAAGTSTATASGISTSAAVAAAAGTSTATAEGITVATGAGSSAGTSTAAATGQSTFAAVANSAGVATAIASGQSTYAAAASAAGVSTAFAYSPIFPLGTVLSFEDFSEDWPADLDDLATDAVFRVGLRWIRHEPTAPVEGVHSYVWTDTDALIAENVGKNRTVVLLSNGPVWASGAGTPSNYPTGHVQDYVDFCSALATRCAGKIGAYEIWNEPNIAPTPWTSAQYKDVFLQAAAAIRAADPGALICGPVTGGVPGDSGVWTGFLQALMSDSEFTNELDVLVYHTYCRPFPPETGDVRGPLDDRLTDTQTNLNSVGWKGQQYSTEFGYPVDEGGGLDVSEADQARFLARQLVIMRSYEITSFQFRIYNSNGYGLFNDSFVKRPSFAAMENAYGRLKTYTPVRESDQNGARVYSFFGGYVAWTTTGTASVTLDSVTQTVSTDPVWWPADSGIASSAGASTASAVGRNASVAISVHDIGTPSEADNANITPTLPAHSAGDLLICDGYWRTSAGTYAVNTSGWARLFTIDNAARYQALDYKIATSSSETDPTMTVSGGSSGQIITGICYSLSGVDATTPFGNLGAEFLQALGTGTIGPINAPATPPNNGAVIFCAAKNGLTTTCSQLSGDSLTWTQLANYDTTASPNVIRATDIGVFSSTPTLTSKTYTLAGDTSGVASGRSAIIVAAAAEGGSQAAAVGSSTAEAIGRSTWSAAGSSTGMSTAAATGRSTVAAVAASAGISTATAIGSSTFAATASSAGTSTATAEGAFTAAGQGVGSAAGTSTASAVGRSTIAAAAAAAGTSAAQAVAAVTITAVGVAAGTSAATAKGRDRSIPDALSEGATGGGARDKKREKEFDRELKRLIKEGKARERKALKQKEEERRRKERELAAEEKEQEERRQQLEREFEEKESIDDGDAGHYSAEDEWSKLHEEYEEWFADPSRDEERKEHFERLERKREAERKRLEAQQERKRAAEQAKEDIAQQLLEPPLTARAKLSEIVFRGAIEEIDLGAQAIIRKDELAARKPEEDAIAALMLAAADDEAAAISACALMMSIARLLQSQ